MTAGYRIPPDALRELIEAINWYDQGGRLRGRMFRAEFDKVIDHCLDWQQSAAQIPTPDSVRTFRQARIPCSHYRVVFYVADHQLTIVAVAHERRLPQYWSGL